MKPRILALLLCMTFLLPGCGWLDGSYSSVEVHREHRKSAKNGAVSAASQPELLAALETIVASGTQTAAIQVGQYPEEKLERGVDAAIRYAGTLYPIGAYAVEKIDYEIGTSGGEPTVALTVTYRRSQPELQRIRNVADMTEAVSEIQAALGRCDAGIVLMVERYSSQDMSQVVEDYAADYPQIVMEVPKVTESVYGSGRGRVVDLSFTYQNSRDDLRNMQSQVEPVFNAAMLYVSSNAQQRQKYAQLYAFLMERFDYKVETSLTPAYSLLHHGVGDSKAFAQVYAAMCKNAGLECMTVTGTCNAEPRTWNLVKEGGCYYHVDLLSCNAIGGFQARLDWEMEGYVWDYSAYPACDGVAVEENAEN